MNWVDNIKNEHIDRKEEINELLGNMPGWLIRWGNTALLGILILMVFGSWIIKYPETIIAKVMLTSAQPPVNVVAKTDGKIERIFVADKQEVKKGDVLACLQSSARYDDVMYLKNLVDSFGFLNMNPDSVPVFIITKPLLLGDIQYYYAQFISACDRYSSFSNLNYYNQINASVNNQIYDYNVQLNQQYQQINLYKEELRLAEKQYDRNKTLFEKDIISKAALEKSESVIIEKKLALEQANNQLSVIRLKISELEQRKLDMSLTGKDNKSQYVTDLRNTYLNLAAELEKYIQNYLLIAPMTGIVNFSVYRNENQDVNRGVNVFNIVPFSSESITGKVLVPMSGAAKVKTGQIVNIKFESYPYMEFGIVKARIKSISLVPVDNYLIAEVEFPDGLKTTYNKTLELRQEMSGVSEIITQDVSLFERVLQPVKSLLTEKI